MPSGRARGIALIFVLILLAAVATGSLALVASAQHASQREREAELIYLGTQFARAIAHYRAISGGATSQFPPTLEALVLDPRFPMPLRHLRRIPRDPITGSLEWGVVRIDGGIAGVYSLSDRRVIRSARLPPEIEVQGLARTARYRDWRFMGSNVDTSATPVLVPAGTSQDVTDHTD